MENPTPLNTGNGNQSNLASVPPVQQVYNTPAPTEQPRVITPEAVPPAAPVTPVSTSTSTPNISIDDEKKQKIKKYIIIAVAAIVFISIVYVAYGMFFSSKPSQPAMGVDDPTDNGLSSSLTDKTEADTTEDSTPPGLNIEIPDTTSNSAASSTETVLDSSDSTSTTDAQVSGESTNEKVSR